MTTRITNENAIVDSDFERLVVRDSQNNIIALNHIDNPTEEFRPFISTDDGETWTAGDTTMGGDNFRASLVIDGSDVLHLVTSNSVQDENIYHQFTIATDGTVTLNVTSETIDTTNGSTFGAYVAIDSGGTIYAVTERDEKIMGTNYEHLYLHERTGVGSWSEIASVATGENYHSLRGVSIDGNDDVHIIYEHSVGTPDDLYWVKYDASAGSLGTAELVVSPSNAPSVSLFIESTSVPVAAIHDTIWKRESGSWSSDQYTTDSVAACTVLPFGSDILVIYDDGNGVIKKNRASFGSFSTGSVEVVEDSTDIAVDLSSQHSDLSDIFWKKDGKKAYTVDRSAAEIHEWDADPIFDPESLSLVNTFTLQVAAWGVFFKPDGSKFYTANANPGRFDQYDMTTNWDISTASHTASSSTSRDASDIFIKPDGGTLHFTKSDGNQIERRILNTPWDLSTLEAPSFFAAGLDTDDPTFTGMQWIDDGNILLALSDNHDELRHYDTGTPYSLSDLDPTHNKSHSTANEVGLPTGIGIDAAEENIHITGSTNNILQEYFLVTRSDINSIVVRGGWGGSISRWSYLHNNEPADFVTADILVEETGNDDMYYISILDTISGAVLDTDAAGVIVTDAAGVVQTTT